MFALWNGRDRSRYLGDAMNRNNLLLPDSLAKYPKSTGVLATKLAVQQASKELEDSLRDWFEQDRIRKLKTYEAAMRYVLD